VTVGRVIPESAVDERLDKVKADLAKAQARVRELEIERDALARIRQHAVAPESAQVGLSVSGSGTVSGPVRLPTAEALYYIFRTKPGLTAGQLVDEAEPILDSTSSDKRALLRSTISHWKRKGRFAVDENGGLHLKHEPGINGNGYGGNGKHP
jgi:hypothetical protein